MLQWEVLCEGLGASSEVIKRELVQDIEYKGREMDADDDETYSSTLVQTEESKTSTSHSTILSLIE